MFKCLYIYWCVYEPADFMVCLIVCTERRIKKTQLINQRKVFAKTIDGDLYVNKSTVDNSLIKFIEKKKVCF